MKLLNTQQKMIDNKVDHWIGRLLDLSGRNRLLFFKPTKTTTVDIISPEPRELFGRLVEKGNTLTFPLAEQYALPENGNEDSAPVLNHPLRADEIGTDGPPSQLTRKLYNLHSRSRTAREEQGVNILFLSFGFLQWRDLLRGELARSPLVLVPVELTREAPGKPYRLTMLEDDLVVNPTLQEALRQFYAIELKDLPDDIDTDGLVNYWSYVMGIAAKQKEWSLEAKVAFDVFSYQKQMIVADLKKNSQTLKATPLVASMSIPGFPLPTKDLNLIPADQLDDKVPPQATFQILDADSSQQEAIEAAKAGLSFVLQGPPGTGKSQTIANIIAEFLASERHVLFVSAKMAALEVVHDRLKKAGLGDFCLQVHSHKRNKREVIEELGQSLGLAPETAPTSINTRLDILQSTRSNLNSYVRALHAPQFGLGLSAFQAYSNLTRFWNAPDVRFTIQRLVSMSPGDFETEKDIVGNMSNYRPVIDDYNSHPWFGCKLEELTLDKQTEIENSLINLINAINQFKIETASLARQYAVQSPETLTKSDDLYKLAREYKPEVLDISAVEVSNRFEQNYRSFTRFFQPKYWQDTSLLAEASHNRKRPDRKKAIKDLAYIQRMQERCVQPSGNEGDDAEINSFNLQGIHTLGLKIKDGIDFLNGLYDKDKNPVPLQNIFELQYEELHSWLDGLLTQVNRLREWVNFHILFRQAEYHGIGTFAQEAMSMRLPGDQWLPAFQKKFYTLWIDAVVNNEPVLSNFISASFEQTIEKFRELDREQIKLSKKRIREKLLQQRPKAAWMNVASSEEAILRREINKKRRIKPLRRLFEEIPGLIIRLRPCMMMSPLTVSQLLDPVLYKFDLVIFDEASQIHPEEAVASIMRGSQAIIVGDRYQLPPTAFFEVLDAEDEDDESVVEDLESILNEGEAAGLPSKMLLWHYRSKDESLIAFSNHNFYHDRLLTFPSARQNDTETGVSFEFLPNGVYQRNGRRNQVEAHKVVDFILDHYRKHPNLSLGVVTFSLAQKDTIQLELDQRLRDNPDLQVFFSDEMPEPGFVKNLELVQGDERDVMIFSIGYGRDETGKFILNFGPLNKEGGERRLNVAVTRARQKVILVSSIQPEDIDLSRTNSQGLKLMRSYMTLARDGLKSIYSDLNVNEDADFESPFEFSVYEAISAKGLTLKKQVGVSGYRIDLAVVDPKQPGRFILGIECDGAMYHSGVTARDRDRLRQEVLEGLGWQIHRIWSRDWIENPSREIEKVIKVIRDNYEKGKVKTQAVDLPQPKPSTDKFIRHETTTSALPVISEQHKLPREVNVYKKATVPKQRYGLNGFYRTGSHTIISLCSDVVKVEGPVHEDVLISRLAEAWEIKRIGSKLEFSIRSAILYGNQSGAYIIRDGFIWPKGMKTPPVRVPKDDEGHREIDQICIEEIEEAAYICLKSAISLQEEDLIKQTAWLFKLRANEKTAYRIEQAIIMLKNCGRIELRDNKIRLPRE